MEGASGVGLDFTGSGVVEAPQEAVFAVVADLGTYPDWLGIVRAAESDGDGTAAWRVDIGARIGPLARTKRLRMIRTEHVAPTHARFERTELDGADHSPWILSATLAPHDRGTHVIMHLSYGGGFALPGLDRLLGIEVQRALPRLQRRARAS